MHRILAACLGILLACATMVAMAWASGTPQAQADDTQTQTEPTTSATDFDSRTAVAQSIEEELAAGRDAYAQGERAKAASHFSRALNTGYIASNLAKLVNDTQGADQCQDQLAQLRELTRLAYAEGNEARIADTIAALGTELAAAATQDTAQPDPRDYAAARATQT